MRGNTGWPIWRPARASIGLCTLAARSVPVHCMAVRFSIIAIYARARTLIRRIALAPIDVAVLARCGPARLSAGGLVFCEAGTWLCLVDFFSPREEPNAKLALLNRQGGPVRQDPEEAAMATYSPAERQTNEHAAKGMVIVAAVWAVIILYFALHSALN